MTERCDLTDLLTDQCAHCKNLLDPVEEERKQRRGLLAAGIWRASDYPGKCAECGDWFSVGAAIRRSSDNSGWMGECCADSSDGAA